MWLSWLYCVTAHQTVTTGRNWSLTPEVFVSVNDMQQMESESQKLHVMELMCQTFKYLQ